MFVQLRSQRLVDTLKPCKFHQRMSLLLSTRKKKKNLAEISSDFEASQSEVKTLLVPRPHLADEFKGFHLPICSLRSPRRRLTLLPVLVVMTALSS